MGGRGAGRAAAPLRGRPADDEDHGRDDHGTGDQDAWTQGLAGQGPPEDHSHDGIHVGVGRGARRRRLLQQPHVRAEGDDGPEDYQVGQRPDRAGRDGRRIKAAQLSGTAGDGEKKDPTRQHLHARCEGLRGRKLRSSRVKRSDRPEQ